MLLGECLIMQYKECPTCNGTGIESYETQSGGYVRFSPYVDFVTRTRECEGCNGHGRIIISPLDEEEDV